MSLPKIAHQRFGYDADGTIGRVVTASAAVSSMSSAQLVAANNENDDVCVALGVGQYPALIFPDHRHIYGVYVRATVASTSTATNIAVEYSTDTTNGHDGSWHDLVVTSMHKSGAVGSGVQTSYRTGVTLISAGTRVKGLRLRRTDQTWTLRGWHVFGDNYEASLVISNDMYLGDVPAAGAVPTKALVIGNRTGTDRSVSLTTEALTDVTPSFAAMWYFSFDGISWYGQVDVPVAAQSTSQVYMLCVLPTGAVGGVHAARVRAYTSGLQPYFTYLFMDSIAAVVGSTGEIVEVNPDTEISAVTTPITVSTIGAGNFQGFRNTVLRYTGTQENAGIASWTVVGASSQAYTSARTITPGTIDCEHQDIVITLPADANGTAGMMQLYYNGGQTYVATSGSSLSPSVPDPVGAAGTGNFTEAYGLVASRHYPIAVPWPAEDSWVPRPIDRTVSPHPQWMLSGAVAPYTVMDGVARMPPRLGAMSASVAYAKSWSPLFGLRAALDLGSLGSDARFLADPDYYTDDGAGNMVWNPYFGSGVSLIAPLNLTLTDPAPYVDEGYSFATAGDRIKYASALIFPGGVWGQFNLPASQNSFSWMLVVVLHTNPNASYYDVLASPSAVTDPYRATDLALRHTNGKIASYMGPKQSEYLTHPTTYKSKLRPVIIGWRESEAQGAGKLLVWDALGTHDHAYRYKRTSGFDLRFFFGRSGSTPDPTYTSVMDVLDVTYWGHAISDTTMQRAAHQLNSAYGVNGR